MQHNKTETIGVDSPTREIVAEAQDSPYFRHTPVIAPKRDFKVPKFTEKDVYNFTVYNGVAGTYTDWTAEARDAVVNDFPLFHNVYNANNRAFFGLDKKFDTVLVNVSVNTTYVGADRRFIWEYWNGGAYVPVVDFYDSSASFRDGTYARINHTPQSDWQQQVINGVTGYFLSYRQSGLAITQYPRGTQAWLGIFSEAQIKTIMPRAPISSPKLLSPFFTRTIYQHRAEIPELKRLSYDYRTYSAESNDNYSGWFMFPFESYFVHFQSDTDTVLQFIYRDGSVSAQIAGNYMYRTLNVTGFRIKNYFSGFNAKYQLVAFR